MNQFNKKQLLEDMATTRRASITQMDLNTKHYLELRQELRIVKADLKYGVASIPEPELYNRKLLKLVVTINRQIDLGKKEFIEILGAQASRSHPMAKFILGNVDVGPEIASLEEADIGRIYACNEVCRDVITLIGDITALVTKTIIFGGKNDSV